MARNNLKILIAGGGIGGITALLALRQRGIEAELFEQAEAFRQVGAGLQVSNNATRVLRTLGLGDALARVTYYPQGRDYRAWDTPTGSTTRRSASAPRRVSVRRTTPRIAPICSMCCSAVSAGKASASARASSASSRLPTAFTVTLADGSTATGDILIGADGIHSTVRGQMFGKELPRYTGNVAWRGLVPAERVAHLDVADVTGVWMGPNRSIVQYYVAAGRTFNWIGISRSEQPARRNPGWPRAGSRMRSPNIPAGTTPSAPSSRRRRSCSPGALRPRAAARLAAAASRGDAAQ